MFCLTYVFECVNERHWRDGIGWRAEALAPRVARLVRADDGPAGAVVDNLLGVLLEAGGRLYLYDALLRQAQVHVVRVLDVEGALVQLRDGVARVQHHLRLVHLAYDQRRQAHARHRAHETHRRAVVDVAVLDDGRRGAATATITTSWRALLLGHGLLRLIAVVIVLVVIVVVVELFVPSLVLVVLVHEVHVEGAPLVRARVEHVVLAVQVASAHRLRSQAIEQRDLGARRDAHFAHKQTTIQIIH